MKKSIITFFAAFILNMLSYGQSFFSQSFKTIDGQTVSVAEYEGKKTLFYILPLSQTDPNYSQLQAFKNRYLDTVRIVGVLSYEDGYQNANGSSVQALYNNWGITITEGMYTKKSSGSNQSLLMNWLTDKTKNAHFNMDATGVGHKFFVNETGRLFAVLPSQAPLVSTITDKIVHSGSQ
jgi:glutathione peroxidase